MERALDVKPRTNLDATMNQPIASTSTAPPPPPHPSVLSEAMGRDMNIRALGPGNVGGASGIGGSAGGAGMGGGTGMGMGMSMGMGMGAGGGPNQPKKRRNRAKLSCAECRRLKLKVSVD